MARSKARLDLHSLTDLLERSISAAARGADAPGRRGTSTAQAHDRQQDRQRGDCRGRIDAISVIDQANEHLDKLADAKAKLDGIGRGIQWMDWVNSMLHDPKLLIAVAIIVGAAFIWFDRRRKLHQEQA